MSKILPGNYVLYEHELSTFVLEVIEILPNAEIKVLVKEKHARLWEDSMIFSFLECEDTEEFLLSLGSGEMYVILQEDSVKPLPDNQITSLLFGD